MAKAEKGESAASNVVRPSFGRPTVEPPELPLLFSGAGDSGPSKPDGCAVDLGGKPTLAMLFGPGRAGKSLLARWMAERAIVAGRDPLLFTMDTARQTLRTFFSATNVPPSAESAPRFLEEALSHVVENKLSGVIDFGADATISHAPGLIGHMREAGVEPVAFFLLTPREGDLTVLARMTAAGALPLATALVLNVGTSDLSSNPQVTAGDVEADFARVRGHSAFKRAVELGAVTLWLPRLYSAKLIEKFTLSFQDAGTITSGDRRLGFFDRVSLKGWLDQMDEQFASVINAGWLP